MSNIARKNDSYYLMIVYSIQLTCHSYWERQQELQALNILHVSVTFSWVDHTHTQSGVKRFLLSQRDGGSQLPSSGGAGEVGERGVEWGCNQRTDLLSPQPLWSWRDGWRAAAFLECLFSDRLPQSELPIKEAYSMNCFLKVLNLKINCGENRGSSLFWLSHTCVCVCLRSSKKRIFHVPSYVASFMSPSWVTQSLWGETSQWQAGRCSPLGPISCLAKLTFRCEGVSGLRAGAAILVQSPHRKAVPLIASLVFLKSKYILPCFYLFSHYMKKGQNSCDYDFDLAPSKTIIPPLLC